MIFTADRLQKARGQGYSDDEIWGYLSSDDRFNKAKQQGYSLDEISSYFDAQQATQPAAAPQPIAPPQPTVPTQPTRKPFDTNRFFPKTEEQEEVEKEIGTLEGIANAAKNAYASSMQALDVVGGVTPDEAKNISKIEFEKEARKIAPGYEKYQKASGWDAVSAFIDNPVEVTSNIIAEGLAGSIPALGAGLATGGLGAAAGSVVPVVGTAAGFTAGQVAGTFAGSLATEYGGKVLEELQNEGMDIKDPNSIQTFFANEELVSAAREKALKKGVPVAAFDAVSAGIGGKLARVTGKQFLTKTGEAAAEVGVQAGLGGGGEIAGSLVAGEPIQPKAVFGEIIGEVGTGGVEIVTGRIADRNARLKAQEDAKIKAAATISDTLEQNDAPLTANVIKSEAATSIEQDKLATQLADELDLEELTKPTVAPTKRATEPPSVTTTPLTTAVTEQIVPTQPAAEAAQPPPTDATQEIIQQESLRPEPQDRVEIGETEIPVPSGGIPTPEGSEAQRQVTFDLQSVAENTANREQISALSSAGLVDIIKGQPVINEDGEALLAQAQAPLPRLTPEERVAEIEGEPAAPELIQDGIIRTPLKGVTGSQQELDDKAVFKNQILSLPEGTIIVTDPDVTGQAQQVRVSKVGDDIWLEDIKGERTIWKPGQNEGAILDMRGGIIKQPAAQAEAPAIVEQAPVVSEEGVQVSDITPEPTISEIPQTSEIIGEKPAQAIALEQEVDDQISETRARIREFEKARKSEVAKDSPRKKIIYDLDDKIKAANESLKSLDRQKGQFELARRQQAETELNEALQVEADKIAPRTATGPLSEEEVTTLRGLRIDEQMSGKLSQISQIAKSRLEARESAPAPTIGEKPPTSPMIGAEPTQPAPAEGVAEPEIQNLIQRAENAATREEASQIGRDFAALDPSLPPPPPAEYEIVKAISDKANRRPYNADALTEENITAAKEAGLLTKTKVPKLTETGRSLVTDGDRVARDRDMAISDITDRIADQTVAAWDAKNDPESAAFQARTAAEPSLAVTPAPAPAPVTEQAAPAEAPAPEVAPALERTTAGNEIIKQAEEGGVNVAELNTIESAIQQIDNPQSSIIPEATTAEAIQYLQYTPEGTSVIDHLRNLSKLKDKRDAGIKKRATAILEKLTPTPAVSETITPAPTPEAPTEIAVGSRVRKTAGKGVGFYTYKITEVLPKTEAEKRTGEQSYLALNEKTGNIEEFNSNDKPKLLPVKKKTKTGAISHTFTITPALKPEEQMSKDAILEKAKISFSGVIPENIEVVNEPAPEGEYGSLAAYNTETKKLELNQAYLKPDTDIESQIAHELGHYIYQDPRYQKAFRRLYSKLTKSSRRKLDALIEQAYSDYDVIDQNEEAEIRAFEDFFNDAPDNRNILQQFIDEVLDFVTGALGYLFPYFNQLARNPRRLARNLAVVAAERFKSGEIIEGVDTEISGTAAKKSKSFSEEVEELTQRKGRNFGNENTGRRLTTPPGFLKMTDDIIKRDYFNAATVSRENTERAFGIIESIIDIRDGYDYARSIVEDVAAKMPNVPDAVSNSVAVVRLQNELMRYARTLALSGNMTLMKQLYLHANRMETGLSQTVERGARAIGARASIRDPRNKGMDPASAVQRMKDPAIAALDTILASDVEQSAAAIFGTQNPTKEQVSVVAQALDNVEDVKMDNEGEILDGLTAVETRANVDLTKKIDEKIKKAGKKKKRVKDIVDSTDAGKEEFSQLDEEAAAAAIKQKAQAAISRKADNIIESLAKVQSDVYVWPQSKTNDIRTIVQQDLRQRPDMGRKEPWMNMLTGKLTQAGVSDTQAQTIAELVWRQHEVNSMNREIAEMEKAAEFGSLGGIIQRIKDTPLIKQQGPDWREGVIRDYLREAGLSTKAAETAARLYNSIIIDRLAKAQQKAFEDTLNKSAPWKNYFARNARLAKGALEKIRLAVRTGALDPSRNLENVIAEQNGWTGFTDKQFQRLAELDEIISDPNVDDVTRTESIVEINKIVADAKLPVRLRDSLGAYYTGQALMGIPTALVNIASPIGFSIRNLFTDIARYSTSDPKNIPIAFETFMESMRTWYDQVSYAFRTQIYRNDVVEYLAGNNTLRELFNKGKKQWENGEYGKGFLNMSVGMAQITGRVLSSLDQGAITSLESQNITRYALEAMKMTSIPKDEQKLFARKVLEARRKTKAQLVSEGMNADRAGVLADLEVRSLVMTELSRLNVPFTEVLESSINDALLSVGRNREITITGLDAENKRLSDKGLISYYPIHFLEQMAESAARSSPGMQVFSRMLYGFALVPARVFHNVAWYSPYGFFRIWREKEAGKRGWEKRYEMSLGNELQYRQRLTDAIAGSIVMLGLAALASGSTDEEDEDKAFRIVITGNGPDAATDRQFHDAWNKKWKPYSIHIVVNGTIIPINIGRGGEALFFPIMLAGALDDWQIKGKLNQARKSPEELNQAIEMGSSAFFALAQRGPFAAFTKPLFDASKEGRATEEVIGQLGFFGKTFIPGIGASVFRNISDMINDPVDRSSVTGSIYANTPMVGPLMGSKSLNALGQPTRVDDWSDRLFRLGVPVVFSFPKDTPENELNELILKQGSGPSFPTRRVAQAAVGRPISDQEFETYVREYGRVMSDKMFKNRKRLENMPTSQYDRELERYAQGFSIDGIPISGARDAAVRAVNRMAQ